MSSRRGEELLLDAVPLFAALGSDTRLGIVVRLARRGPASLTVLSQEASVTRQAVRKHLDVLEEARLVRGRRAGREHIWELEAGRLHLARRFLDQISEEWGEALESLRHFVEREGRGN